MADYPTPENKEKKNGARQEVAVVAVSFPAQSHLNSLLHLCRRISTYNLPIYYVGAATHILQAKARIHGCDPSAIANLHFHEFPTPPFPKISTDSNSSGKFPSHLLPMFMEILPRFHEPLLTLVKKLSAENDIKKVVIVFDALMTSVVHDIHQSFPNVECYSFQSIPAFFMYSFFWEATGKREILPADAAEIMEQLPSMEGCFSLEFQKFTESQRRDGNFHSGAIYNTSRIMEGLYLDLVEKSRMFGPDKHWALGPLSAVFEHEKADSKSPSECLEWLDKQPPNSVIFVSFGTTCSFSDEEVKELALGLERSEQRFVWVLRDADTGDIFEGEVRRAELPQGFEERVRERGIVVREWAPQLQILEHCATGGFLSHCGWNSCLESISLGVPIAAWPMHSDQPRNAVLITKVLKVGVEVRDWARREEVVSSVMVEEGVRRLMASAEGEEMRRRVAELADSLKQSMVEGGAGRLEMDSFVDHIACIDIDEQAPN
ncbi:hypothetical protein C2S53_018064 [Perilla frutescens var. hirtella]|uniref:Glycosyltransferase n=1 Tax=Perilla frutescens var. hirtella TaxID=608512 RepID=A0AAD4P7F7_PERFH|nr:hypothetical protein C2S53_018064 [Perilla frutescens var. hirtella]